MKKHMLSQTGTLKDLVRRDYIFEPKLDGVRSFLIKDGNEIKLMNRNHRDITFKYPELQLPDMILPRKCVLDGELIVYNEKGMPDFHLLMRRDQLSNPMQIERMSEELPAVFVAFDIVELNGEYLGDRPLEERKEILENCLEENPRIQTVFQTTDGMKLWDFVMQYNLEGIMAKNKNSHYLQGARTENWIKIKNFQTQDCLIIGWSSGVREISSLGLAAYEDGELRFIGKVGTGFTTEFLNKLYPELKKLEVKKPEVYVPEKYKGMHWVKPELVCEVQYLEFGSEGMMRNPSFLRMRPDKPAEECIIEQPRKVQRMQNQKRKILGHA
jgi:bifunctional non-homologous end joining protein LigD